MNDLVLYILMRTDLASLNSGKAMAQSNHAYGALKKCFRGYPDLQPGYLKWMSQTEQEFGTTIVLGGTQEEINGALYLAKFRDNIITSWVHDPTYPISDGDCTHFIPLDTCAFVFGPKEDCQIAIKHLELHR